MNSKKSYMYVASIQIKHLQDFLKLVLSKSGIFF